MLKMANQCINNHTKTLTEWCQKNNTIATWHTKEEEQNSIEEMQDNKKEVIEDAWICYFVVVF